MRKVGIVGCGIAGQTAAILLAERGHDVTIFERFERPAPLGAGLLLQPTGLAALAALGLLETAYALGARIEGIDGRTWRGRRVLDLRYADLAPGCAGLGIHRASLFELLYRRLLRTPAKLVTGSAIVRLEQRHDGTALVGENGAALGIFELVLVCDGAHSQLRAAHAPVRHDAVYPWGCAWTTLQDHDNRFAGLLRQRFRGTTKMIGLLPVGANPQRGGEARNWLTLFWSQKLADFNRPPRDGLPDWPAALGELWPELAPYAGQLQGAEFTRSSYRDVALKPWRVGRTLFLGDSCHGTSPQLGQGANMAMLDALCLAQCLQSHADLEISLAAMERQRRGQIAYYRWASRFLTPFYQSDRAWLGWLRDLSFGPACRVAPTRHFMLTTLAGLRRDLWRADKPDPHGLAPLAPWKRQ